eukprot:583312_1
MPYHSWLREARIESLGNEQMAHDDEELILWAKTTCRWHEKWIFDDEYYYDCLDTGVSFIELLSQRTSGQLWSIIRNEQGLPYHTGLLLPLWSRLISDIQSRRAIGIWISCCDIDKEELPLLRHNTRIKKNCRWYSIGT